jgi:hypothetical protein
MKKLTVLSFLITFTILGSGCGKNDKDSPAASEPMGRSQHNHANKSRDAAG